MKGPYSKVEVQFLKWVYMENLGFGITIEVLWNQPIKLIQVAPTSELLENQRNDLVFFKIIFAGPQKPQKLTALKIKHEKFGPQIFIPH